MSNNSQLSKLNLCSQLQNTPKPKLSQQILEKITQFNENICTNLEDQNLEYNQNKLVLDLNRDQQKRFDPLHQDDIKLDLQVEGQLPNQVLSNQNSPPSQEEQQPRALDGAPHDSQKFIPPHKDAANVVGTHLPRIEPLYQIPTHQQ